MIRILSTCETAQGGVGRYQDGLRALEPRGFALRVLLPEADAGILEHPEGALRFRRGRRGVPALVRLVAAFLRARRAVKPHVHLFNSTFALLPLAVLRLLGDRTPAVYCAHCWAAATYPPGSARARVVQAVEGRLAGLADLVVNVSHGDRALARRLGYRGRQVVVENAVADVGDGPPADLGRGGEDEVHLLFVGRFDPQKGLDVLLPAFERARRAAPHLRLHLVGGPVRGGTVPPMPEGAAHHGWLPPAALPAWYRAADALVVPSRWEGLPLTVPEALRAGTPVLVSDRSDMGALVEEGRTGHVFALREDALAERLAALRRPALAAMRPAARASYEARFSLDRLADAMAAHLRALVEARR